MKTILKIFLFLFSATLSNAQLDFTPKEIPNWVAKNLEVRGNPKQLYFKNRRVFSSGKDVIQEFYAYYDTKGNLDSIQVMSIDKFWKRFYFDKKGRISRATTESHNYKYSTYCYNSKRAWHPVVSYYYSKGDENPKKFTKYEFDDSVLLKESYYKADSTFISSYTYSYDKNGKLLSKRFTNSIHGGGMTGFDGKKTPWKDFTISYKRYEVNDTSIVENYDNEKLKYIEKKWSEQDLECSERTDYSFNYRKKEALPKRYYVLKRREDFEYYKGGFFDTNSNVRQKIYTERILDYQKGKLIYRVVGAEEDSNDYETKLVRERDEFGNIILEKKFDKKGKLKSEMYKQIDFY